MEFVRTEPGEDPIIVEGYFAASPKEVFQAWTIPEEVMKWFGPTPNSLHSAIIDLRPGGAWQFFKSKGGNTASGFEGEYLVVEPGVRLIFTWSQIIASVSEEHVAVPISQVEITFTANGEGTDVCLVHSRVDDEDMRKGFAGGWERGFTNVRALFSSL